MSALYRATADGSDPGDSPNIFIGEGAYEGLVALMESETAQVLPPKGLPAGYGPCNEFRGIILDQPPVPGPYLPD